MMKRRVLLSAMLVLMLSACAKATPPGGGGGGGIDYPAAPAEVVLRVSTGGGLVPIEFSLSQVPEFDLYGDGTVVTTGPQIEIYPPPALPNLLQRKLTPAGVQAILAAAQEAGLFANNEYAATNIMDAPGTTITVNADGGAFSTYVYPAGEIDDPDGEFAAERAKVASFTQKLGDLESWLPQGSVGPEEPYQPTAMRVYATPYQPGGDPELRQQPVAWPLAQPIRSFRPVDPQSTMCAVVTGSDLDALLADAAPTNTETPWVSAGKEYRLVFRPLLPDETGCDEASASDGAGVAEPAA